jgi:hypothetical protein
MYNIYRKLSRANDPELQSVIEPLASYICATDQPRLALKLALMALTRQVEQTNRTANAQVARFRESRLAASA